MTEKKKREFTQEELEQFRKEAAYWDSRKGEKDLWKNLEKEGWINSPERAIRRKK